MTNEELTKKWAGIVNDPLTVRKVDNVNYKPHPFTVGPEHVTHAADHCGGWLGEATTNVIGCAWQDYRHAPKCRMSYKDHTSDRVMFLSLTRNCAKQEAQAILQPIADQLEADKIDGVAFVKNEFTFKEGEA